MPFCRVFTLWSSSLLLFGGGSIFFMQLLQHEYVSIFFANNFLAILLKMETFSGSSMFQSQKRSQSKNEDQEKNAILTQIFQGTIGIEVWIRLKNPRRSRRIQKEQIQSQFFATALFNTIIKTGSIFRPTPVYKMVDSRQQA